MQDKSIKLYKQFDKVYEEVKERIMRYADEGDIRLTFWSGYGETYFDLSWNSYPIEEKVKGKNLEEMVDELCRRISFIKRQEQLLLVDSSETLAIEPPYDPPTPYVAPVADDEIPF